MHGLLPTTIFVIVQDSRHVKWVKIRARSTADHHNCARFGSNHARLRSFTMDYLSYEEIVPLLQRSYFADFRFLKRDDVVKVIEDLSDEPYGLVPETVDKDKAQSKNRKRMTAKEVGKLSKAAQILIMSDERKAAAISNIREIIHKELQAVPASNEQTCGFDAILQQISNTEYIYNKDGEQYSADNLRVQMIHFIATYADLVYPEATRLQVLPCAYKQWLLQQLDPQEPLDELGLLGLRLFLKVSSMHTIHILLQIRLEL